MISKLPRWVEYGAFSLALTAGCINVVGLLGFEHQAISHLSGTVTLIGVQLFQSFSVLLHLIGIVLSFVGGAVLTGWVIAGEPVKIGRHYDSLLFVETGLLIFATLLLHSNSSTGHYLASAACGLQNALVTQYSGAIIRTTHLTGIFTDLGIMLGNTIAGKPFDKRKAILFISIILGFIVGAVLGSLLFLKLSFSALLIPAAICFLLGLLYRFILLKNNKQ